GVRRRVAGVARVAGARECGALAVRVADVNLGPDTQRLLRRAARLPAGPCQANRGALAGRGVEARARAVAHLRGVPGSATRLTGQTRYPCRRDDAHRIAAHAAPQA